MNETLAAPSLLPFLNSLHQGFRLELKRVPADRSEKNLPRFPFVEVSDAAPLTRILDAGIVGPENRMIRHAFLLISKDRYTLPAGQVLTNIQVEESWQKAFKARVPTCVPLGVPGADGHIEPFSPLFFCRSINVFFHPPCPACGHDLELCRDDELLAGAFLKAYSRSLNRYLFCPRCAAGKGDRVFYSSRPEDADPASVKGPEDLVKAFAGLVVKGVTSFPCSSCSERDACYAGGAACVERITPVSFYPFHALLCESADLNALDFLALVSGAQVDEMEAGLNAEPSRRSFVSSLKPLLSVPEELFFFSDFRRGREVLYLKLCFLRQAVKAGLEGIDQGRLPDAAFSLESSWISLDTVEAPLPLFWGMKLRILEPGALPAQRPGMPEASPVYGLSLLGLLWLQALCMNKRNDAARVYDAVLDLVDKHPAFSGKFPAVAPDEVFGPAALLWEGIVCEASSHAAPLWNKALDLGWSLVEAHKSSQPFNAEGFLQALDTLRGQVKQSLFEAAPALIDDKPSARVDQNDGAIHAILEGMIQNLSSQAAVEEKPALKPVTHEEDSFETVILSSDSLHVEPGGKSQPVKPETRSDLEGTVIIGKPVSDQKEKKPAAAPPSAAQDLTETVVGTAVPGGEETPESVIITPDLLGKGRRPAAKPQASAPTSQKDDLVETVMMAASPLKQKEEAPDESLRKRTDEEVPETVMMNSAPGKMQQATPGKTVKQGGDEEVPETMIMQQGASPGQKPSTPPPKESTADTPGREDSLEETIVYRPDKKK